MRSRGNVPWAILLRTTRRTAASFIFAPRRTHPETAHVHSEGGNLGARCHGLRRQDAPTGEPAGGYWTILLSAGHRLLAVLAERCVSVRPLQRACQCESAMFSILFRAFLIRPV